MRLPLAFLLLAACGDNRTIVDARIILDAAPTPNLGPLVELGMLPERGAAPFTQGVEPSIATFGTTVVVTYVNLGDADPTTYKNDGDQDKRAAVAVSTDRGTSFGAAFEPSITTLMYSTDPVIRTASDGTFWMTHLGQQTLDEIAVAKSSNGTTWQTVATVPALDKEWFAIDETSIWLAYLPRTDEDGFTRLDFTGNLLARAHPSFVAGATGMYVDDAGMHVAQLTEGKDVSIARWNAVDPPVVEGERLPVGKDAGESSFPYTTTMSLGRTPEGGQWIVRTVKRDGYPAIVLRIRHLPSDEGVDVPVSEPNAHAFLPTAIVDEEGRLRVVYYDTSGATGVLRTTRSRSRFWSLGFESSTVIDFDASPGERWVPTVEVGANESGGRRLREYIDIALTNRRIHVAYTHSPSSPSRVRATYFDY